MQIAHGRLNRQILRVPKFIPGVNPMFRFSSFRLIAPLALLLGAACADHTPTAPPASAPLTAVAPRPDGVVAAPSSAGSVADFVVTPAGGRFTIGSHVVSFPDHSICDPATSSYGPTEWKVPCVPLNTPIAIHAVARTVNGDSYVDFTPSLRFVPTTDPQRYVTLTMSLGGSRATAASKPPILWAQHIGAPGINEEIVAHDATLRTYLSPDGMSVHRRVEHFTGYVIATGYRLF
ncbi:MAG: hypothetical protein NVS1B4_21700 [Gemmatimonadaceae bacterium]